MKKEKKQKAAKPAYTFKTPEHQVKVVAVINKEESGQKLNFHERNILNVYYKNFAKFNKQVAGVQ